MLKDEARLIVKAGNGGPGKVSFFPGKKSGPDGGDGGNGGNVYAVADRQIVSLQQYTMKPKHKAEHGEPGGSNRKKGAEGADLTLRFPVGTLFTDIQTGEQIELLAPDQPVLLAKGGKGGRGNDAFKSSTNTTPRFAQQGTHGQERRFKVIMRLIADYGLIGLPNAGKSSLLNALTQANVKAANYPFTTLEPNLGAIAGTIIADIPGLIEGASGGKGLGVRFLKHIEKVRMLLHCISVESDDVVRDYKIVRRELTEFNQELLQKPETVLLTKCDLVEEDVIRRILLQLQEVSPKVIPISLIDDASLSRVENLMKNNGSMHEWRI